MKRSRLVAVLVTLAMVATMAAIAVPRDFQGMHAKPDGTKVRYGNHVYSFWRIGNDIVPWDETSQRIPPFLTLKKLVLVHELHGINFKVPRVDLSAVAPLEAQLDNLARDCNEVVETIDWVEETSKGGFKEALAAGGISDRKDLEDLVARATWYQGDKRMDVAQFRNAVQRLGDAAKNLAGASRKFRGELGAVRAWKSRRDMGVLDYKNDVLTPRAVIGHLRGSVSELAGAVTAFDEAVRAFFPASVTGENLADAALPTELPALNRLMGTLWVLHQKNATQVISNTIAGVRAAAEEARQILRAFDEREKKANVRAERSRSLVAGWIDQRTAEARRFLNVTSALEENFRRLDMEPGPVFYQAERQALQGLLEKVSNVATKNPSEALRLAARAERQVNFLKAQGVLPGEHVTALQGKLEEMLSSLDEDARRRARANMDKALAAFHNKDVLGALTALEVTTSAILAGEKVPMVSANTGEPVIEKDDVQITVVPPPPGDSFQNPWFLGLVSAALLVPLLVLLYVVRRREARVEEEVESTVQVAEEPTHSI